jgi:hypothetical protein
MNGNFPSILTLESLCFRGLTRRGSTGLCRFIPLQAKQRNENGMDGIPAVIHKHSPGFCLSRRNAVRRMRINPLGQYVVARQGGGKNGRTVKITRSMGMGVERD